MQSTTPRPKREAVLVALHGDGFVEVFGEKNFDVRIVNVPHCPGSEVLAEDTLERILPIRYRDIFWPVKVRASAMHKRLKPTTMKRARQVKALLGCLNSCQDSSRMGAR